MAVSANPGQRLAGAGFIVGVRKGKKGGHQAHGETGKQERIKQGMPAVAHGEKKHRFGSVHSLLISIVIEMACRRENALLRAGARWQKRQGQPAKKKKEKMAKGQPFGLA